MNHAHESGYPCASQSPACCGMGGLQGDAIRTQLHQVTRSKIQANGRGLASTATLYRGSANGELLLGRMKALFSKGTTHTALDLDEFFHNKILFKLRRRIGTDRITPEM